MKRRICMEHPFKSSQSTAIHVFENSADSAAAVEPQMTMACRHQSRRRKLWSLKRDSSVRVLVPLLLLISSLSSVEGQSNPNQPATTVDTTAEPTFITQPPPVEPTITPQPTLAIPIELDETLEPTTTPFPTVQPSTPFPTSLPSSFPTVRPTLSVFSTNRKRYRQTFVVVNATAFFTDPQTETLGRLYSSYTDIFGAGVTDDVISFCEFLNSDQILTSQIDENGTYTDLNDVSFTCSYDSPYVDTSKLSDKMLIFLNTRQQKSNITLTLQSLGFPVLETRDTSYVAVRTPAPSISHMPSAAPSIHPTITSMPTTMVPTGTPTTADGSTPSPTTSSLPPTLILSPIDPSTRTLNVALISSVTILCGFAILIGLVFFYQKSKKKRSTPAHGRPGIRTSASDLVGTASVGPDLNYPPTTYATKDDLHVGAVVSPSASVASKNSFLSGGSGINDESDDGMQYHTQNLQDEFDMYKDQNLEILRSSVEGNLTGFEGIMSAAVTKALMGGDDSTVDPLELTWGCHGHPTGEQIEASVMCEVMDWAVRNDSAPLERKRAFMQDILNKMVTSVRYGVLNAEDASRTIHESAALLGLQIAHELPVTTVIVSGMRKTVKANDVVKGLREFGDIQTAAVASGHKGFGIIRFRNPKSIERAMRRYRNSEIVVQDVAVRIKVLLPSGEIQSRSDTTRIQY